MDGLNKPIKLSSLNQGKFRPIVQNPKPLAGKGITLHHIQLGGKR